MFFWKSKYTFIYFRDKLTLMVNDYLKIKKREVFINLKPPKWRLFLTLRV